MCIFAPDICKLFNFRERNYDKKTNHVNGGLVLSTGMALAQTTVTGKVVSQEDGEPVIGASVKSQEQRQVQ